MAEYGQMSAFHIGEGRREIINNNKKGARAVLSKLQLLANQDPSSPLLRLAAVMDSALFCKIFPTGERPGQAGHGRYEPSATRSEKKVRNTQSILSRNEKHRLFRATELGDARRPPMYVYAVNTPAHGRERQVWAGYGRRRYAWLGTVDTKYVSSRGKRSSVGAYEGDQAARG